MRPDVERNTLNFSRVEECRRRQRRDASRMDSFNPTTKTQAAISSAAQAASMAGNPDVTPAHLLGALLAQADGIAAPLLAAVGADATAGRAELDVITQRLPSATG